MSARPACEVELVVPFHDVDAMRIVWHGHYFKYFEIARTALFDRAGVDLVRFSAEHGYVFPVVRSAVKHVAPLRYRDRFVCSAVLAEARVKLALDFEVRRTEDGALCAKGRTEQAAVKEPEMALEFAIPEALRLALGVA